MLGLAAAAAAGVVAVPAAASASTQASPVVGHLYVNDNTAGTNTIGAFNRHVDGTLTPEAGSPFAAGGAGTGAGLASQGALQQSKAQLAPITGHAAPHSGHRAAKRRPSGTILSVAPGLSVPVALPPGPPPLRSTTSAWMITSSRSRVRLDRPQTRRVPPPGFE